MYGDIIKRFKPRGWRVQYSYSRDKLAAEAEAFYLSRKPLSFRPILKSLAITDPTKRTIYSCRPKTLFTLHVLLHEFAHVNLEHWGRGESELHKEEFEADRTAAHYMRLEGLPINRAIRRGMIHYAGRCVIKDHAKGNPLYPHVKRAVKRHLPQKIAKEIAADV